MLTGALVGGSCALLGCFLVLRQLSMLGDAISHAVLPGIVIAFLLSGSRGSLTMFLGAVILGVVTTFLVEYLSHGGVQGDAAIGVTFTSLFAIGVVLVSLYGGNVDLDLDCVLYGEIAYTPFDMLLLGGKKIGPRPIWIIGGVFVLNLLVVSLFYKQLKICAFDPGMAAAVGIRVSLMHYLLMGLVSVTTVSAFESVGAILVVAMLIVPGATAYLLTNRLGRMLAIAVAAGVLSSVLGYQVARWLDCSIAGAMATVSGVLFALAFLFSPLHGVVSRWVAHRLLRRRVAEEDVLLWAARRLEVKKSALFTAQDLSHAQQWLVSEAARTADRLARAGLLTVDGDRYSLTDAGHSRAVELLRRHRLYESYLADLGYPSDHVHDPAHRVEHHLSPDMTEALDAATHHPDQDPHGKPILR
jgi:manganese/zinc/iron transport system permease protein